MIRKLFLCTAILTLTCPIIAFAQAQQAPATAAPAPIFIKPYVPGGNTYNNPVPTIVTPTQTRPRATAPNRLRANTTASNQRNQNSGGGYQLVALKNPYEGSTYARLMTEKEYFDPVSKKYMGQYEYMKALSDRGDTAKLNSVRSYVQQNGVFDPQKYKIAMEGGGLSAPSQGSGQTSNEGITARKTPDGRTRVFIQKDSGTSATPQKLHEGYDDQPAAPVTTNRPIFLR